MAFAKIHTAQSSMRLAHRSCICHVQTYIGQTPLLTLSSPALSELLELDTKHGAQAYQIRQRGPFGKIYGILTAKLLRE